MKTIQKHKNLVKRIKKKLSVIQEEFPETDFDNHELRRAYRDYEDLIKKLIYAQVDYDFCNSESCMKVCSTCDCGKNQVKR